MNETENKKPAISKLAIAPILLGLMWIPVAFRPGPGDSPWLPSPWFLLWPAFCIFLAISVFTVIRKSGRRWAVAGIVLNILLLAGGTYAIHSQHLFNEARGKGICAHELGKIGATLQLYANNHQETYPLSENWCDSLLLVSRSYSPEFVCARSKVNFNYVWLEPNEEASFEEEMILVQEQENGVRIYVTKISTYAMNPNCDPNSPPDTVLLFETKGGWNQHGGPELLTFDNHRGRGANVLFNDGHVEFVKPEDVGKLKWKVEDVNNSN